MTFERIATLWCVFAGLLVACGEDTEPTPAPLPAPFERVDRLEAAGVGAPRMIEAHGETRMASLLDVGARAQVCAPEAEPGAVGRSLQLGVRSTQRSGLELIVRIGDEAPTSSPIGLTWRDAEVALPESASCAALELSGPPGSQADLTTPLLLQPGRRRPWVILYVVDTLRFDFTPFVDGVGNVSEWAPALQALAADGIVYRRMFSTSSWVRPAAATLLTGVGPSLHRVYDRQDRLPDAIERLPGWLAARGWLTEALSSNSNVLPLWGFLSGFDRFVDVSSGDWVANQDFQPLTQRVVLSFAQRADQPLFMYVHDNEPHSPYRPGEPYRELFGAPPSGSDAELPVYVDDPERLEQMRSLYRASIRSMSDRVAEMVTGLKRIGRYEDSLIVLVGGHCEEFGEHGGVLHGKTLFQEQLHVPLVIKPPLGTAEPGVVEAPASTASVVPTLLGLLGYETPAQLATPPLPVPGEDVQKAPIYSELDLDGARVGAAVLWPWKYVRAGDGNELLFDLEADVGERLDQSAEQPEVLHSLRTALDRHRAAASAGLALACIAGPEDANARFELEVGGEAEPRVDAVGLDLLDRVRSRPGAVEVDLQLRPAVEPSLSAARFRASVAARAQPDRDIVRLPEIDAESIRIRALGDAPPLAVEGPDGLPLELDAPIPLSRLTVSVAPLLPEDRDSATCVVYHLVLSPR